MNILKLVGTKLDAAKCAYRQAKINEHFKIEPTPTMAGTALRDLYRAKDVIGNYAAANNVKIVVNQSPRTPDNFLCSITGKGRKVVQNINPNQKPYKLLVKDNADGKVKFVKDDTFLRHFYRFVSEAVKSIKQ